MTIQIEIERNDILQAINRLQQAAADLEPAMRAIAGVLEDASETAFAYEVDPATQTHWEGLFTETVAQRQKLGYTGLILQRTGHLADSIVSVTGSDFAMVGTNKAYAAAHQFGFEPNNLVARPFLGVGTEEEDEILAILVDHLSAAI